MFVEIIIKLVPIRTLIIMLIVFRTYLILVILSKTSLKVFCNQNKLVTSFYFMLLFQ